MRLFQSLILSLITITSSFAGHGVERGKVIVTTPSSLQRDIKTYLEKKLVSCASNNQVNQFIVTDLKLREDKVDQGIVDLYYTIDLLHKNQSGRMLNLIQVEVEDVDYSNYRHYHEKLSITLLKDLNNNCHL